VFSLFVKRALLTRTRLSAALAGHAPAFALPATVPGPVRELPPDLGGYPLVGHRESQHSRSTASGRGPARRRARTRPLRRISLPTPRSTASSRRRTWSRGELSYEWPAG